MTYAAPAMQETIVQQPMMQSVAYAAPPLTTSYAAPPAATTMVPPTYSSVREAGAPVYVQGPAIQEERAPIMAAQRQEQIVAGEVRQNFVEIPTQEVVEQVHR